MQRPSNKPTPPLTSTTLQCCNISQ